MIKTCSDDIMEEIGTELSSIRIQFDDIKDNDTNGIGNETENNENIKN